MTAPVNTTLYMRPDRNLALELVRVTEAGAMATAARRIRRRRAVLTRLTFWAGQWSASGSISLRRGPDYVNSATRLNAGEAGDFVSQIRFGAGLRALTRRWLVW